MGFLFFCWDEAGQGRYGGEGRGDGAGHAYVAPVAFFVAFVFLEISCLSPVGFLLVGFGARVDLVKKQIHIRTGRRSSSQSGSKHRN